MRNHIRLVTLLAGYLENNLTTAEMDEFSAYVEDPAFAAELTDLLGLSFYTQATASPMPPARSNRVLNSIIGTGWSVLVRPLYLRRWFRIAIAAAIVIGVITAGLLNVQQREDIGDGSGTAYQHDVAPGRQGATLTLASGRQIKLDNAGNGEIAEEAGITISKTAVGQLRYEIKGSVQQQPSVHVLSTARGETFQLHLPDGTLVYLNAASSLTYSSSLLHQGMRRVTLSGEGYFEVAKDKAHPFVVACSGQEVQVLGTHFNISAYHADEQITTTLIEGAVKIHRGQQQKLLEPGQQAINDGQQLRIAAADIPEAIAWKEGYFRFSDTPVPEIMEQLARWYAIDVRYQGKLPAEGMSGRISRYKPISDVLRMLENTGLVKFKIEGRRITVLE